MKLIELKNVSMREILNRLFNGETLDIPANGIEYGEIKRAVNELGFILNWTHERYSPSVKISILTVEICN